MATGLVQNSENLIGRLIGIANSAISTQLNQNVYLNSYTNPHEIESVFPELSKSYEEYKHAIQNQNILFHPASGLHVSYFSYNNEASDRRIIETEARGNTSLAKFANLHTATSLRHAYLKNNAWPEQESAGELLPAIDLDPFAGPDERLKILPQGNDRIVYSIGPDKTDQQGRVEYDATNGTISHGDITLLVRQKPLYPFSSKPKQYNTREELLNDYPNGLPTDPFADTRNQSLIVSDTTPPVVWSIGPDANQGSLVINPDIINQTPLPGYAAARLPNGDWRHFQNTPDEPQYDPSNGTISNGNLYLLLQSK